MKFTAEKSDFLKKLTLAMGSVSNKNTITSIEGVLLETTDDGLVRISTYDMNKGFRATFPTVSIEREGKCIINAQRLFQTVKVLPDDEITVEVDDKLNCTVFSGKASFSMFAMNGADFPNMPELISDRGFEISGEVLRNMIGKVIHSVAEQDTRPMLCGAFFKIDRAGLDVVSTNGYTLSKCRMNCDIGVIDDDNINYSFIIPGHALSELQKILGEGGDCRVKFLVARRHAIIKMDDIVFFTRTIDSEYIDYERVIPKDNSITVVINKENILSALERANIIAEEKIQGRGRSYVKIIIDGQCMTLTSASANGKVSDEIDCVHEGDNLVIGFNCRYLINSIRVAEGENIKIRMKAPTQAIVIEADSEDEYFSYLYMVLPVKMNEEAEE